MHSKTQKSSNQKKLYLNILMLIALSLVLINISLPSAQAQRKKPESIKRVIVVKDYKWSSGGMGRAAIMSEITIENRGRMTISTSLLKLIFILQMTYHWVLLELLSKRFCQAKVSRLFII